MKPGYRNPILKAGLICAEERDGLFPSSLLSKPSLRAFPWEEALGACGISDAQTPLEQGKGGCSPCSGASYYRHLPFVEDLHGKRRKNAQLVNQNVTPNGKILLYLTTESQTGLGRKGCKDHHLPPPTMSRDMFHRPRYL